MNPKESCDFQNLHAVGCEFGFGNYRCKKNSLLREEMCEHLAIL